MKSLSRDHLYLKTIPFGVVVLKFPEIAYSTEMLIVMTMDKQIGIFYFILQFYF
jgi:hypothetical protein